MATWMNEMARAILYLLSTGHTHDDILRLRPDLTRDDLNAAVAEALRIVEAGEPRADRVARVRRRHANAFEPWTPIEDKLLVEEFQAGASIAALGRAFKRPPGAIRMRLQKLGHDPRRSVVRDAAPPPVRRERFEWGGGP